MKKTILITGSTDGIGKLAALKFATDRHEVILHGRNADKLQTVIAEIRHEAPHATLRGFVADFADLEAVKGMATQIMDELSQLDVLINNAGVYKSAVATTVDGLDTRFAVNYLAPIVLTRELLPLLKKGAAPRILNLSSAAQAPVSLDVLTGRTRVVTHEAYAQSKLALTMWSTYLAQKESGITVIAVNPGSLLNTRMVREGFGRVWAPADKGANILYDLAILERYASASGKYFDNDAGAFGMVHPAGNREDAIKALMEKTDEWLGAGGGNNAKI